MTQNLDRLGAAFDQCVESALPSVDYAAWYNCQVVSQNADGSVDLQPNVSYIPSQKNIQLLFPFPGVKITVQEGAQVLLGWSNGDPAYPVAALWAGGSPGDLQTLSIAAAQSVSIGANAVLAAARETDPISANAAMVSWMAAVVAAFAAATPPATVPPGPPVIGTIESGSAVVTLA